MEYKVLISIDHEKEPLTNRVATIAKVLRVYNENEFEQAEADYQMLTSIGGFKDVRLLPASFQVDYGPKFGDFFTSGGIQVDKIALLNNQKINLNEKDCRNS